ncbi:hypothetical protein B296_00011221 [Ensete ventricosum]|uniref:Uncharacterized protein n=1 Tax=Ensete ventricosum TaxID=4639 RepID=A0A427AKH5_ENSVE|nr:hypothetical protein B296_00011221 [Ensete ventricosum]
MPSPQMVYELAASMALGDIPVDSCLGIGAAPRPGRRAVPSSSEAPSSMPITVDAPAPRRRS